MNMRLKMAIMRSGARQYLVARRARMSETRLSRIVVNRVTPTEDERRRIADALEVSEKELFA